MAILVCTVMAPYVSARLLAVWIAFLAALCVWGIARGNLRKNAMRSFRTRNSDYFVYQIALLGALGWAAPFWFTGAPPDVTHSLVVWSISLFVMMIFTTLAHSITLACILFIAPITISGALALGLSPSPSLAIVPLLSGALMILICLRFARTHLRGRLAEEGLRDNRETVSLLLREFETSADWLWQTDRFHRLEQVSSRLASALGTQPSLIDGLPFLPLLNGGDENPETMADDLHALQNLLESEESFAHFTVPVIIGGERCWWQFSAAPRFDEKNQFIGFRGVGSDVTQQHHHSQHIAYLARVDSLTGLPNRLSLYEAMQTAVEECLNDNVLCGLLIIDLDRFKSVNDTLGHAVGDRLLAQVAKRLQGLMDRRTSCGRLGGDEFAVVMRRIPNAAAVEALAQHIITTISRPYQVKGHQLFVGASIGFAIGVQDGATVEELARNADLALYKSKDRGGNCVAPYVPKLHAQAEERLLIEQELRGALERRELQIYYQPVVNAQSERLLGFEALLRWNSSKLGPVSPTRFIPVAEESRLIGPIGEWVLRMACHEAMSWPGALKVAVNVSPEQLTDPYFTAIVDSALAQSGLPPHRLEIEVTESVFVRDGGAAAQVLDQLLAIGIHLSLDDFGTGYSSLGYLRKARFSTIKIDRSFVASATKGSMESIAIIRAIVALADGLGMSTTAEGVETEQEVNSIRELGCRNLQGFHYGRPMTPSDIRSLFPADSLPAFDSNG